ncbi:peptide/nickel transport system substrate-binding protein [Gemmobacter megaterium]|uniref:Peptide/nickel transport system substrate-binding protein n=1 Tax=Gemmobacter megaterium TaxID=1086013 RepID=A0A1N7QFN2_9RHOB|nr:ABC transporter substrate-binding protein [Gemmobacter megaterium]GGE25794.1 ABC transporter substrate-binding protein [Gemmobacter megaterium]SIT21579.1 peptide/nickel transport system substrate-binding protein [Gemmobacter megaterium]
MTTTGKRLILGGTLLAGMALAAPALAQDQVLRVGINAPDITTLDPHRASATGDKGAVGWIYNGLLRFPPGNADPGALEPDLAESWTTSDDGLEWVFTLREGVAFHGDWGVLTAEDVVYSLERAKDPERSSFAAAYAGFQTIEALDPRTVRIVLAHPVPGFLGLLSNYHGGHIVSKAAAEAAGADFGKQPVGTGPFAFVSHQTQQSVTFARHDGYFRGTPKITGIDYRLIQADASRELAFTSGELDLIYGKREQRWIDRWAREANVVVDVFWPAEFRTLHLNTRQAPLDDRRVREAVARAINIDEIVAFVGADVAPKGCSVIPSGYLGEECSAWVYGYDPAAVKKLLAEAGHPDGITIKQVVSSNNAQLPIMEVIQAQLAASGIKLDLQVVDHPTYHDLIRKDLSGMVFYGSARFPIADSYLTEYYHSDAIVGKPTAITNFSHCDVADAAIEAARVNTDPQGQLADWAEAQRLIHEEICAVPLFNLRQVWLRSDRLDYGYDLVGAMNLAPPITELTELTAR